MKFRTTNYINPNKIVNKYEVTELLEDEDMMDTVFRNILKDRTPDKPSLESDFPRKCSEANGVIDRRYGRATDNDMYMPDLFLGDLSKDPRSIMSGTDLNGMREFMEHRKDAYKVNMLNDDDKRINTKTMTHAEVRRAKDAVFHRVKNNYTNFSEQTDQGTRSVKVFSEQPKLNYSRTGHKSAYVDKESSAKSSKKQALYSNLSDYTVKKTNSRTGMWKKSTPSKVDLHMQDSSHKISQNDIASSISKKMVVGISQFMDRKLESLDDYKLSASLKDSMRQKTKMQIVQSEKKEYSEVEKTHTLPELLISNRVTRNMELFNAIRDNPNLLAHKGKLNELLVKTSTSSRMSPVDRMSSLLGSKDKYNSIRVSNTSSRTNGPSESVANVSSLDNKYSAPLLIYNYKMKKPERIQQSSEKSQVIETYADRSNANKASVTEYKQIRESHKEEVDHTDFSTSKLAGMSGSMGSKYLVPGFIFKDPTEEHQITNSLRG